jgi:hypothetical protein
MTRTEAIASITRKLASFDDERVQAVAEIVAEMDAPTAKPFRALSNREAALLEQSKADFAEGRTVTLEESRARTDALFARFEAAQRKSG